MIASAESGPDGGGGATQRPRLFVLGLGGPYNSGKSTLTDALVRAGAFQIDVDKLGHLALEDSRDAVIARFGTGILTAPAAPIDRKALGRIVFADPLALRDLEAIIHPAMVRRVAEIVSGRARDLNAELGPAPGKAIARVLGGRAVNHDAAAAIGINGNADSPHELAAGEHGLSRDGKGSGSADAALAATQGSASTRNRPAGTDAKEAAAAWGPFSIQNLVVVNAALLFKMKLHPLCDLPLWVDAPFLIRLLRGLRRDKLGLRATWKRILSQASIWPQLNGANADIQRVKNLRRASSIRKLAAILKSRGLRTEDAALLE